MIIMAWHSEITQLLEKKNYSEIITFYENKIEKEPENITLYWYLGLAYLLSGQEAEAGSTWLIIFSQGQEEDLDIWTEELTTILEAEAERQFSLNDLNLSWLIRQQIFELAPNQVNNLLHLVNLEIALNRYQITSLKERHLIDLLEQSEPDSVDLNLLRETLINALKFPCHESVDLARAALAYAPNKQPIITLINDLANHIAYDKGYPIYAVDLNELFFQYEPDNFLHYKDRFYYYVKGGKTDEALEVIKKLKPMSDTVLLKVFTNHLLLHVLIIRADWPRVMSLAQEHKELIKSLTREKPLVIPNFLTTDFIIVNYNLLYIEDNPAENRPLINEISRLFQNCCQKRIADPNLLIQTVPQPHKRLRVGYIAHTLRRHSVGWLSRWLFHYHDREKFEIYIYLLNQSEEEFTKTWFASKVDKIYYFYRDTLALAKQIKADEIDILVDLDSLTFNLTCQVMSYKLAPVQLTWLGLDASGIPAIDYYIADPYVLPENAQDYYREKIWRLPQTYLGIDGFEVGVPTLRRENLDIPPEGVIYLNIQNAVKRHPHTLDLQMQIIKAVPNSYFLTKGSGEPEIIKQVFTEAALRHDVSPERLRFLPKTPDEETHRANLAIADVVLDTYPYNGATTTLEVLWMGIPIVTRVGEQFAARNSYAFMTQVGLTEGVAWSDQEYIEWGIKLGTDPQLRQQIREKLYQSRQTSPLWNGKKFTQDLEQAYQQMWQKYLQDQERC